MVTSKKTGGAKTARTETVTVRLDPELRYLAEIAARIQRRTLSSYIEWAIMKSLEFNALSDTPSDTRSVADRASDLWDVDEADRFVKLGLHAPHLLNYDEQKLWKLIRENGYLWKGRHLSNGFSWDINEQSVIYPRVRKEWPAFKAVVYDGADPDAVLPKWKEFELPKRPKKPSDTPPNLDDLNSIDDVPF